MSLGVGYGQAGPQSGSVRLFWENYAGNGNCFLHWDSTYTFASNTAIFMKITESYESGQYYWYGYAWIGSQWRQLFRYASYAYIDLVFNGLELEADNQDKNSILVPLAFTHKATLYTTTGVNAPWDNVSLPSYLQNHSSYSADTPWQALDVNGTNFTSMSALTTYQ